MSTRRTENTEVLHIQAVRRSLWGFVAASVTGLLVVSAASVLVAQNVSRDMAVRDAVGQGRSFATVSAPLMHDGVSRGDPESVAAFSEVMHNRLREGAMVHLKVWDAGGTILWADQAELRGRTFELDSEVKLLFESGGAVGYLTELDRAENVAEPGEREGDLLQVYAAARSRTGERLIVESYWSTEQLEEQARAVLMRIAPLSVGALLLLALVVFPLAWSLARRVERIQGENGVLLQHALDASDLERQRIARDLHDGVMQDVTVVGFKLSVATTSISGESELPRRLLDELADRVHRIGEALRSTMADIYPIDLASQGLAPAVEELAARAQEEGGVAVSVAVVGMEDESSEVTRLSYRVIREGLRNVVRHAHASHAEVLATREGDTISLSVDDDGRGPDGNEAAEGHLGLKLLRDTMRDVGGALAITPRPGGGTHFTASFPSDLARADRPKVFPRTP